MTYTRPKYRDPQMHTTADAIAREYESITRGDWCGIACIALAGLAGLFYAALCVIG